MHKLWAIAMVLLMASSPAGATSMVPDFVARHIPNAATVGTGRYTYMTKEIYDAVLYAPDGQWQDGQPMALSLTYLTNLKGHKIAQRSVAEIRQLGFTDETRLSTWDAQMKEIFPDVANGTSLTGVYTNTGETRFFKNGELIGQIADKEFGTQFFNIWLNQKSSAPALREALLEQGIKR
jgi:hypothetical protein